MFEIWHALTVGYRKNTNKIFAVVMATKLKIMQNHCKQSKFFCIQMLCSGTKSDAKCKCNCKQA